MFTIKELKIISFALANYNDPQAMALGLKIDEIINQLAEM